MDYLLKALEILFMTCVLDSVPRDAETAANHS